ncbi:MAG: serine hydroxymethyltransferase [Anaerolineaceae bacterium]|nr:serine hydroxymethyltransferase [Anaerolineaceae bacterium]
MQTNDFLFRGNLEEIDPDVAELVRLETARQSQTLIMIPSESTVPEAVREAVGSSFHNIYAEGYPLEATRRLSQAEILDYGARLTEYRRRSDLRYYKGTEYANIVEALARRRVAESFATQEHPADSLYVNVQPLSGAPANSAVYTALLDVGDIVMGMDLITGGHLTHGSPVNRSGLQYHIVSYGLNPETERLDYEQIRELALTHRPKMIIAGYSSYPFTPDWHQFRAIADEVGAFLLADVAHVAGLILADLYPNPVGIADVVTFTTHKSLHGPRGAVAITHQRALARKIDRAVFPGEQGGPHVNSITALAVAMRIAATQQFKDLQQQIVDNAATMADRLRERGIRIPHGGTNTHLFLVDCKTRIGADGTALSGDMAARILDLVGIVANRQTIPGDRSALRPSGLRFGTNWISQRGAGRDEVLGIADVIADLITASRPYSLTGRIRRQARAKVDFETLRDCRDRIRRIAASLGSDTRSDRVGYPHNNDPAEVEADSVCLRISGKTARAFLHTVLTSNVADLEDGQTQVTALKSSSGDVLARGLLQRQGDEYVFQTDEKGSLTTFWLRALSDNLTIMDETDVYANAPGPVVIEEITAPATKLQASGHPFAVKAYGIAAPYTGDLPELPRFAWQEEDSDEWMVTPIHPLHQQIGARMAPFAGYEMPLWYSSVADEHRAVRENCGIFDVAHMGVYRFKGPGAERTLDALTTNDVRQLRVGTSHYTFLLDVDGQPLDDLLIYRLGAEEFLAVVNAANDAKNWAWINAAIAGEVRIDEAHPKRRLESGLQTDLQDLRATTSGSSRLVDLALQGPKSRELLLSLGTEEETRRRLMKLPWAGIAPMRLGDFELYVSRTGYTGERIAYELFVHPEQASSLFQTLLEAGATPCGLAARDSLRTEAGLPLYGQELAGPLSLNPADAGFSSYVKLYQPFFVGKSAFIASEQRRDAKIVRFRSPQRGMRPAHGGDPLVDARGRVVGNVTSCSVMPDGHYLGLAFVKQDAAKVGSTLGVIAGSGRAKSQSLQDLRPGTRLTIPQPVEILRRFPAR